MKNLKKVLALVLCCAMVFGVVATAAGTNYPDVPADATYAEAVEVLSSLGIIQGDNEGKFNPDATITRAEMAKILYTIVSRADVSKTATKFADVPADHWASGYIAYCTQLGYIDGYDATTFGPEDPVTYEQVLKLVLCAMGYKPAADYSGGYPTGYLMVAADIGLTKGLTSITGPDEAPRKVVAMAVYNAINTPIMKQVNYGSDAKYVPMDGSLEANYVYQTLLNKVYSTYKVEGIVVANSKTSLQGNTELKANYVKFNITNTLKVDPVEFDGTANNYPTANSPIELPPVYAEGTDADSLLGYESVAYITKLDDGSYQIVSIVPKSSRNVEYYIAAADQIYDATKDTAVTERYQFNLVTGNSSGKLIYSYWNDRGVDSRIQSVEVDQEAKVIWNGEAVGILKDLDADLKTPYVTKSVDGVDTYVYNSNNRVRPMVGNVTLVDVDNDGDIDIIESKSYSVAVVRDVNTTTNRISFKTTTRNGLGGNIVLSTEENENLKEWSITLDGNEIAIEDIKENDVLNICSNNFSDPTFFEIIVTRNVVEGKVSEKDENNNRYGIDGEMYRITNGMEGSVALDIDDAGYFYLDMDGRIAYVDTTITLLGNYGYLLKMGGTSYDDDFEVKLLNSEGTTNKFTVYQKVRINGVATTNASTDGYTKGDIDEMFADSTTYTAFGKDVANDPVTVADMFATYTGYEATDKVTAKILIHALTNSTFGSVAAPKFQTNFLNALTGSVEANSMVAYDAADGVIRSISMAVNAPTSDSVFNLIADYSAAEDEVLWKANTNRFGSRSVSEGAKVFCVEGTTEDDYQVRDVDYLKDGKYYNPILMGYTSNGAAIVLLLNEGSSLDPTSALAIYDSYSIGTEDGTQIRLLSYYENGAMCSTADKLKVDPTSVDVKGMRNSVEAMQLGDTFIYSTNSKGLVDAIYVLFAPGSSTADAPELVEKDATAFRSMMSLPDEDDWGWGDDDSSRADSKIFFGYLADSFGSASNSGLGLDVLGADGKFTGTSFDVPFSTPVVIYHPAYNSVQSRRLQGGKDVNDIDSSYYGKTSYNSKDIDFSSEDTTLDNMGFVFVRTIDDVATEVIYINYAK